MNSTTIKAIIVFLFALFGALYFGIAAATAQLELVLWVVGGISLAICVAMGRSVWLLMPLMGAVNITLQIPGQPSTLLLAQALVFGFCVLLFLMRRLPFRLAFTELEFFGLILTLLIMQVYLRNPVSIKLFGGDTVGGRGYILYAVALTSAFLFCVIRVPAGELKWILPLSIIGGIINLSVSILGQFIPTIGIYTGTNTNLAYATERYDNTVVDEKAATRVGFLASLGNNLALWISSYISPLKACFRPLWGVLIFTAILAAAMSGFRNSIAAVGITFLLGIAYRSGLVGVTSSIFGGIVAIAVLAVVNTMHPLPPNIQRALTVFPGTWEQRYKDDAKGSNEWRIEIWEEALLTDRWIANKWLGDGLGFTAVELAAQQNLQTGSRLGISGFDAHREAVLSNGDYHSGPVSTIRVIGYIGLFFFLLAQIRLAVHAHRQIIRCRDTEWLPLALFLGIPLIAFPLFFVFIFGDFKSGAAGFLLSLGMIRLLENNLPLPVKRARYSNTLPRHNKPQNPQARMPVAQ